MKFAVDEDAIHYLRWILEEQRDFRISLTEDPKYCKAVLVLLPLAGGTPPTEDVDAPCIPFRVIL
jgi:hypothetical protein